MSSALSSIGIEQRRRIAATLGLFATLFMAVGVVAATGATTAVLTGFAALAFVVAVLLGLMTWGVVRSIKLDVTERRLDAAIGAALTASGRSMCDCGVEHDPDEMHVVEGDDQRLTGTSCRHDGSGTECSHSCDSCVLAAMRPSPHRTRAERLRTS